MTTNFLSREELFKKFQLDFSKDILLLMPGSRKQEIKKILPCTLTIAAKQLAEEFNMQTVIACSANLDENIFCQRR